MKSCLNRQWLVAKQPERELQPEHFAWRETGIGDLEAGEVLLETHFLNIAPVMRMYMMKGGAAGEAPLSVGDVIHGRGVAEILASKHPDFSKGEFVQGQIGWQTHKISRMTSQEKFMRLRPRGLPVHYALAVLGMTGFSAWFGLIVRGEAQRGDTVLVSGAVGGVGSLVVQLARIRNCGRIIGIAGGEEKRRQAIALGCDDCIDYRSEDLEERISALCPGGIDLYFDNVGGEMLETAIDHLAPNGRIVLCGSISEYQRDVPFGPTNYTRLRSVEADMRGFFVYNHAQRFDAAEEELARLLLNGSLKPLLDIVDGFEQMPGALMDMFSATRGGKRMVNVMGGPARVY